MKKILSALLCVCMVFSCICVSATEVKSYENNISVYGQVNPEREGESVSILLYANDTSLEKEARALHVGMTKVGAHGKYQYKFKVSMPEGKTLSDYTMMAKIGGDDITQSIVSVETNTANLYDVEVKMDAYFNPEANITNVLGDATGAKVILASYTSDHKLCGVKILDANVPFGQRGELTNISISENIGGDYVRAFMWDKGLSPIPLAKDDKVSTVYTSKFKDGDVVTFTGASNTHLSTLPAVVDHFYQTRYPNMDIVITNTGIGGDTIPGVLGRLEWDVYDKNPNIVYLYCGGNDIHYYEYVPGDSEITEKRLGYIDKTVENLKTFIDTVEEDGKTVVISGSCLLDEGDYEEATVERKGANHAVGVYSDKAIEVAKEKGVDLIEFYRLTNEFTDEYRSEHPGAMVMIGPDRVHMTDAGYTIHAAMMLLAQGNDEVVATVDIDVDDIDNGTIENAVVNVTGATSTKVSYTYAPGSIPLAASTWYKAADAMYPVTERLNQEIIKVSGLEEGSYTIKFTDEDKVEYNLGTYTNSELENGVNIAINEFNPGQIQSLAAFAKQSSRKSNDVSLRTYVGKYIKGEEGYTLDHITAEKAESEALAAEAKEMSVPKAYTVVIEKQ